MGSQLLKNENWPSYVNIPELKYLKQMISLSTDLWSYLYQKLEFIMDIKKLNFHPY